MPTGYQIDNQSGLYYLALQASSCCPFNHHHGVCKAGAITSAESKAVIISLTGLLGQTIYQKKDEVIDAGMNLISCQKSKGPEKSGNFPKKFVYAGPDSQTSKYFQWNGNNSFTELPSVEFPEEYPIAEITLESESLMRILGVDTPLDPTIDTTIAYVQVGNLIAGDPATFPIGLYLSDDQSRLEFRGYGYNFNYYNIFSEVRDYYHFFLEEGVRNERSIMELLDAAVAANQDKIMPNDTIQLKLYEIVFELE